MGRPESEKASSSAGRMAAGSVGWQRRRLARALLSALAGGGLTAAGLGGAAAQSALAAGPTASAEGLPSGGSIQATGSEGTGTAPRPLRNEHHADHHQHHPHDHQHDACAHHHDPADHDHAPEHARAEAQGERGSAQRGGQAQTEVERRGQGQERRRGRRQRQSGGRKGRPQRRRRLAPVGGRHRRSGSDPQLQQRLRRGPELLPRAAVPAADLQGGGGPVRRAVADPRRDQRNRDRLRHRPVGLERRCGRLDAVHAGDLAAVRRRRPRRGLRRPLQPRRRDLRRRPLPARGRCRQQPQGRDPGLQPLRRICELRAAAGEADHHLPARRDRDPHRPDRRAPAGHRQGALVDHPGRQLLERARARPRAPPRRAPKAPPPPPRRARAPPHPPPRRRPGPPPRPRRRPRRPAAAAATRCSWPRSQPPPRPAWWPSRTAA